MSFTTPPQFLFDSPVTIRASANVRIITISQAEADACANAGGAIQWPPFI